MLFKDTKNPLRNDDQSSFSVFDPMNVNGDENGKNITNKLTQHH